MGVSRQRQGYGLGLGDRHGRRWGRCSVQGQCTRLWPADYRQQQQGHWSSKFAGAGRPLVRSRLPPASAGQEMGSTTCQANLRLRPTELPHHTPPPANLGETPTTTDVYWYTIHVSSSASNHGQFYCEDSPTMILRTCLPIR